MIPKNTFVIFTVSKNAYTGELDYAFHTVSTMRMVIDQAYKQLTKEGWQNLELWQRFEDDPNFILSNHTYR